MERPITLTLNRHEWAVLYHALGDALNVYKEWGQEGALEDAQEMFNRVEKLVND